MKITKRTIAEKMEAYLRREIARDELVDWAESAMMDGDFDERDAPVIASTIARLGLADVRAFGLTWEDCVQMLEELGFSPDVRINPA